VDFRAHDIAQRGMNRPLPSDPGLTAKFRGDDEDPKMAPSAGRAGMTRVAMTLVDDLQVGGREMPAQQSVNAVPSVHRCGAYGWAAASSAAVGAGRGPNS